MNSTLRFLAGRLLATVIVLIIISALTYLVFYLLPSDPAQLSCGKPCTPERLAGGPHVHGLRQAGVGTVRRVPGGYRVRPHLRCRAAAIQCSAPCFGYSFRLNDTVTHLISSRFGVTFSIAIGAAILWLIVGVAAGVVSAIKRGTILDRVTMTIAMAGVSAPSYLVGLLGISLFGFKLNMVPVSGYVAFRDSPVDWAWHLILPWCVLAFISAAIYARLTRGQMLDVLSEDYIRTARSKGLGERRVIGRHALRNVLIPVITIFGLDLGGLLGGAVITEKVFSMQGLGALLLDAVGNIDLPLIVGVTLFSAFLIIIANVVVDMVYGLLDPRV